MPEVLVEEPDPQVIRTARAGDLAAFETLVRRYQADVWRLCMHLLQNETLADDATQDAFVRAFRFLSRYRGESKFSTWLFSIARNTAMDELRRVARGRRVARRLDAERAPPERDESSVVEVREAIGALPIELREPMVMIDLFGMSYRETAQVLKLAEGTVKSRVHRAREAVASMLRPVHEGVGDEG